ncbi:MAG: FG-GAP-like repeat-containing protein, partial [Pyrinomonadaceae bacterium]
FSRVNDVPRRDLVRVNADGTLDASFNPTVKIDSPVTKIVVQADGKILLGGSFTVNNNSGIGLVRLNFDGSLDAAFTSVLSSSSIALQPDGKILVGGSFIVNGQLQIGLLRFNSDGTTDTSFNPAFGTNTVIRNIAVQADGKIMVGGTFNAVNGFARQNLVRLNADGSLDAAFNAGSISQVNQIEILPDGKYLVLTTNTLARLNNNGTTDAAFRSPNTNAAINVFLVQPDGTIIIGGNFTSVNNITRSRLARLRADGSLDGSFFPSGADNQIRAMVRQADGKIIISGDFTRIENVTRLGIARLNVSPVRAPFTLFDFDGDGRADISVFRPSNGVWYRVNSSNNVWNGLQFGLNTDKLAPADYDGDGRTDIAVFRDNIPGAGNFAYFYITNSSDNSFRPVQFGATGDVPVSGDWDGDEKADLAVYRDGSLTDGQSYFYYRPSSQPGVDFRAIPWGGAGDKPVVGDFDGDGKLDAAIFRPSNAYWYVLRSSDNQTISLQFGISTDIPTPMDFDGDGKTNIVVFRPSNGTWYTSTNPATNYGAVQFGAPGDLPVPADYDGDGKSDFAVYRPSSGAWYILRSSQGFTGVQFGISEDKPIPNVYIR